MKYKVGDRVFHKNLGWGIVRGVDDSSCLPYAIETEIAYCWAHDCDGLCKDGHGFWYAESVWSRSDSLWNDIRPIIREAICIIREEWNKLTLWGKFFFPACVMVFLPIAVGDSILGRFGSGIEKLCDKFIEIGDDAEKKLAYIFRIYKE